MKWSLANKVAVVTGSAGGLGQALARELHRRGCHLALLDIDYKGLVVLKDALETGEQKITIHPTDVAREQDVLSARAEILGLHGRVDILINNAGISISRAFGRMPLPDYKRLFDVNFWGAVYCTRHFLPELQQQPDSHLVNIVSDFALMGFPGKTAYASSKAAVTGFTNVLKTELADTGVQVSLVIPPPLDTGLVAASLHESDDKRDKEAAFLKKHGMATDKAARIIVRRFSKGEYRIVVGALMYWVDAMSRLFPTALHRLIGKGKKWVDFV